MVILDDLGARKLAQREGFRVQGGMAVLEACFRKGFLADLRGTYQQLLKRGVFLNRQSPRGCRAVTPAQIVELEIGMLEHVVGQLTATRQRATDLPLEDFSRAS